MSVNSGSRCARLVAYRAEVPRWYMRSAACRSSTHSRPSSRPRCVSTAESKSACTRSAMSPSAGTARAHRNATQLLATLCNLHPLDTAGNIAEACRVIALAASTC